MRVLGVDGLPSARLDYSAALTEAHRALWDAGVTVDFAHSAPELSRYRLVIAPALFLLSDAGAENLRRYVAEGGTLLAEHATRLATPTTALVGRLLKEPASSRSCRVCRQVWKPSPGTRPTAAAGTS